MKKLYISDLDGTLLHPNICLSPQTITTLNTLTEQGMQFTVATARTYASVKRILKDVKLTVPIILMNGVCIYDTKKEEYIKVEAFSENSFELLISIIKQYQLKGFAYTIKNGILSTYYEDLNSKALHDFYQERVTLYNKLFLQIDSFATLRDEQMVYFSLIDLKEKLEPIYRTISNIIDLNCVLYKDNYSPDLWYLEVYSKSASKYHGVKYLRESLGFEYITCFGDNHNDIPLFEASDYKIAVGNAIKELKEKADLVIGYNYDDGVAAWLKQNAFLH